MFEHDVLKMQNILRNKLQLSTMCELYFIIHVCNVCEHSFIAQ